MSVGVGLDFGTTNSSVALARDREPPETLLFPSTEGPTDTFRSLLYFEPDGGAATGPTAIEKYLAATDKGRLIQSLKSFLASRLFTHTEVFGRRYTVEDLVTIILRDLWSATGAKVGSLKGPVVVGRPVRFSNAQTGEDDEFALGRLRAALEAAGIGPVIFEYEPVAAACFYEETLDHDELIMIGDFGGGTSDFSLLHVGPASRLNGSGGERLLGTHGVAVAGDAFDGRIVRNLVSPALGSEAEYRSLDKTLPMPVWLYSELERWHYLSFLKSDRTLQMLRSIQSVCDQPDRIAALLHVIEEDLGFDLHRSVQATKTTLSAVMAAEFVFADYAVSVRSSVQRPEFEAWIREELDKIRASVGGLLSTCGVHPEDVDRIFLTGGSSLVPAVRNIFERLFGAGKIATGSEFTSVARGLAARALQEAAG